jgi:hypothetical protein
LFGSCAGCSCHHSKKLFTKRINKQPTKDIKWMLLTDKGIQLSVFALLETRNSRALQIYKQNSEKNPT